VRRHAAFREHGGDRAEAGTLDVHPLRLVKGVLLAVVGDQGVTLATVAERGRGVRLTVAPPVKTEREPVVGVDLEDSGRFVLRRLKVSTLACAWSRLPEAQNKLGGT
jgi:hypothetical protein